MNKVTQYCSSTNMDGGLFTADQALKAIEYQQKIEKTIKLFTDFDYNSLKTKERPEKLDNNIKRARPDEPI